MNGLGLGRGGKMEGDENNGYACGMRERKWDGEKDARWCACWWQCEWADIAQ